MHWIIHRGFFSEPGGSWLLDTLERFGISHSLHDVVPVIGDLVPEPELAHLNVIGMGSFSMRHYAAKQEWNPGIFDLFDQDFEQQRVHWGDHLLNSRSRVTTVRDASFPDSRMFVRPVKDTKYFTGRVFERSEFLALQQSICAPNPTHGTSLTPETLIQISEPRSISEECRFWVVAGEIIASSPYERDGQPTREGNVSNSMTSFVTDRIREWCSHEAFVIDACQTADDLKIVEINTLNSSAFYAADVPRLVMALEDRFNAVG
ncbi:ATP-grasp domain-containing protein [Haloferula sp. BvORR071]|uniref:ATP-grasp domain-containing protein n=1 Tax=Haloferula sp. BvORR071 TaxID=1396141 RepID=UPI0005516173|nr:ATP-grasp domain-containing protein [Haloferula sp. BvORR071]